MSRVKPIGMSLNSFADSASLTHSKAVIVRGNQVWVSPVVFDWVNDHGARPEAAVRLDAWFTSSSDLEPFFWEVFALCRRFEKASYTSNLKAVHVLGITADQGFETAVRIAKRAIDMKDAVDSVRFSLSGQHRPSIPNLNKEPNF